LNERSRRERSGESGRGDQLRVDAMEAGEDWEDAELKARGKVWVFRFDFEGIGNMKRPW